MKIHRLARIALEAVKGMAIIGVVLALLLANPFVQTYLAGKATKWLKHNRNIDLHVEKLQIIFPNQIGLKNVVLYDDQGDTVIYTNQFRASVAYISANFSNIGFSKVYFDSTHFCLITHPGDSLNGFMRFLKKLSDEESSGSESDFKLKISDIHFEKFRFRRKDVNIPTLPEFDLHNAHMRFRNFILSRDSISAHLVKAYGIDHRYFEIHHLQGLLTYSNDHISITNLQCTTDRSMLDMDAALRYSSPESFQNFENAVDIGVRFRNSWVNVAEMRTLLPVFPDIPDIKIDGHAYGTLNDFIVEASNLEVGNYTQYHGEVSLQNVISDPENPFIRVRISDFKTQLGESASLVETLAGIDLPDFLRKNIFLTVKGGFEGTPKEFVTAVQINFENEEEIGLNFQMSLLNNQPSYMGQIGLKNVDIGRIFDVESLGSTTASVHVVGRGFEPEKMNLSAQGTIQKLYFNDYTYQNIDLSEFILKENNYNGKFYIKDPNISASSVFRYTHQNNSTFTEFNFNLEKSNPHALKWTSDSIVFLSFLVSGIADLGQAENPTGNIVINDIFAENSLGNYHFESIKIISKKYQKENQFELKSDFASMKVVGNFHLFEVHKYIHDWFYKRLGRISNQKHPYQDKSFEVNLQTENLNAMFALLYLEDLNVEPGTQITAAYNGARTEISLELKSRGIRYKNIYSGQFTTSWNHTSDSGAEGLILASNFKYDDLVFNTVQFRLDNTPDSNAFELLWTLIDSLGSEGHIDGWLVKNLNDHYRLHFDRSEFNIGVETFVINPANYFDFEPERIYISNFQILNGPRSILVNGVISQNAYEILRINVDNFRIDLFNIFLKPLHSTMDGIMKGEILVNDLLNEPKFASDFEIDSLRINGYYQGDFYFSSDWNVETKKMDIASYIQRGELKTFEISGIMTTFGTPEFNLICKTNRFRLNALSPVLGEFVKNLRGTVNGEIAVKGRTSALDIKGQMNFPNLGLTIPLLGTDYNFEGVPSVTVTNREINFTEMIVRDTKTASKATLNGKITHRDFKDFRFNIGIDANRFLALNTNATSGDLYYGTAYVTGKILITGPTDEPVIDVNVRTERGTLFALPLNNPTEVGRKSFINFVEKDDEDLPEKRQPVNFGGLTLRFSIDVTPEAEAQLILDDRYNDMMRANGQGRISLMVPPSGDIKLVGNYQITKGVYNFNFQGLVSRKFIIEPGSTITFTGDPLAANLDITTRYTTRTTLRGLLTDERYLNTRTQVDLLLKITGVMLRPEISFDIKVPRAAPMVQTEINNALADRDKLTRQAFSLLLLNSFMTDDFAVSTSAPGATLVYDAFVSQISNLLAQRIKGVDIRLGYSQTNLQGQEGSINQQQDLELGISTTLFNDRFVINTNFDLSTQQNGGTTRRNDFAGDVELEYLITSDGKFRAKAFNRSLQNRIGLEQVGDYAQGVGLTYRTNFDSWYHDILRVRRKRKAEDFQFEEPDTSVDSPSTYYPKNEKEWKH
ncbi:MAG: translocation/assembly module TamB domain-containing protein [Thermaurantimonas sp.]